MSLGWLTPDWLAPPGVHALSTWRGGGVSKGVYASLNLAAHVGDDPRAVAENRRRLVHAAQLPAEPAWLNQVHGTAVADLDIPSSGSIAGNRPGEDAAVTREPGRICAILTADCVPVVLAAADGSAVAAAHAGWRGLAAGVLAATLRALAVHPDNVIAWIGPCIGPAAYEVGDDVRDAMLAALPGVAGAFRPNARGRFMADLPMMTRLQLHGLGVKRVFGGSECTLADPNRYFSHRRDGPAGRQATLAWLGPR